MQNKSVKLSVVVPVYNVEDYLAECIDSLCKQWNPDYEIILVDDGATDSSGKICDDYAKKYDYISVIHQENRGLGGARNSGTLVAKGEYIAWIDSDDYVDEKWAVNILKVIHDVAPDVIVYDFSFFSESYSKRITYGRGEGIVDKVEFIKDVIRDVRIQAYAWQKIIKRNLCLRELYCEDRLPLEDYEIMYRLLKNCDSVYYINENLYWYRQRENSLVRGHDFEQSWHSYQLAIEREREVEEKYKNAAITARCIQGYRLCSFERIHKRKEKIQFDKKRCGQARTYIRKNLIYNLVCKEVTRGWKIRFILVALHLDVFLNRQ